MAKVAVITGATKGIGRAVAIKFVQQGFDVAVCARNKANVDEFKAELLTINPHAQVWAQACDVSNKADLQAFADFVNTNAPAVDVLVNNAGVFLPGQVYKEEEGTLETLIETNLYSAYRLSRALVPGMISRRAGHIFNMCSVASIKAYPNGGSYSISKYAMLGLSKALREELKEFNIKVTSLIPGATYTNSWEGSGLPQERFMTPEDIADAIWGIYTLSPAAVVEEIVLRPLEGDI
jgi:short-subunit dehydrogenase